MKRKNKLYFICEDGHLTVGNSRRTKCSHKIIDLGYEKNEKNKWKSIEKSSKMCDKNITETHDIYPELKFTEIWDEKDMRAFLADQRIDEDFVTAFQKAITDIYRMIKTHEDTHT